MPSVKDSAFLKNLALGFRPGASFPDKVGSDSPFFFVALLKKNHFFTSFLFLAKQDAFLDAVYGIKLILSIIMGVAWGIIPLTGATGFIAFVVFDFSPLHHAMFFHSHETF